jgi:WD40 repeat protein
VVDLHIFGAHDSYVLDVLFSPDGGTLVSAGMDNLVKLWSVDDWQPIATFVGHTKSVNSLALAPDGTTLASGSTDGTVKLWSFPEGQPLHQLRDRKKTVTCVCISADGEWVAAACYGGRAAIWTLVGEPVVAFAASDKNLSAVAISPDRQLLATAGLGDDVRVWSLPGAEQVARLSGHAVAVPALQFIDNGRQLVSLGHTDQTIRFWETAGWQETREIELDGARVRHLAFSPDERTVALSAEGSLQLRATDSWRLKGNYPVGTKALSRAAFSPDGRLVAVGGADRKIRVWTLDWIA